MGHKTKEIADAIKRDNPGISDEKKFKFAAAAARHRKKKKRKTRAKGR